MIGLLPSSWRPVISAPICALARARASTITSRPGDQPLQQAAGLLHQLGRALDLAVGERRRLEQRRDQPVDRRRVAAGDRRGLLVLDAEAAALPVDLVDVGERIPHHRDIVGHRRGGASAAASGAGGGVRDRLARVEGDLVLGRDRLRLGLGQTSSSNEATTSYWPMRIRSPGAIGRSASIRSAASLRKVPLVLMSLSTKTSPSRRISQWREEMALRRIGQIPVAVARAADDRARPVHHILRRHALLERVGVADGEDQDHARRTVASSAERAAQTSKLLASPTTARLAAHFGHRKLQKRARGSRGNSMRTLALVPAGLRRRRRSPSRRGAQDDRAAQRRGLCLRLRRRLRRGGGRRGRRRDRGAAGPARASRRRAASRSARPPGTRAPAPRRRRRDDPAPRRPGRRAAPAGGRAAASASICASPSRPARPG